MAKMWYEEWPSEDFFSTQEETDAPEDFSETEALENDVSLERRGEFEQALVQDEQPRDYHAELEDAAEEAAPASEKRLKREIRAEALRRLEDAARTEADFQAVIHQWDQLDRNRERRERDHENLRGDVPLEYRMIPNPSIAPIWMNNPAYRQLCSGNYLDILPKNHFIRAETMSTEDYLSAFFPFENLDVVKQGVESCWSVSEDRAMMALTMTFADEPMAKNMSFQRQYAEPYDWIAQQLKDWAFNLSTTFFYYNAPLDKDSRQLLQKSMKAFGGIAPTYHIELLDKPTLYWDFHSLLLGIQMMFSFMLVDASKPLKLCKHCQWVFLSNRSNAEFCSPRCRNQHNSKFQRKGTKSEE